MIYKACYSSFITHYSFIQLIIKKMPTTKSSTDFHRLAQIKCAQTMISCHFSRKYLSNPCQSVKICGYLSCYKKMPTI
jgi:hypothetical protein